MHVLKTFLQNHAQALDDLRVFFENAQRAENVAQDPPPKVSQILLPKNHQKTQRVSNQTKDQKTKQIKTLPTKQTKTKAPMRARRHANVRVDEPP